MKRKEEKLSKVDAFLAGYEEEALPAGFAEKVAQQAIRSAESSKIITIKPAWKRLSLAASVAAFAVGLLMSNPLFSTQKDNEYEEWNFGEQGLYSYLMEQD
jgi:hypothetical protein